jgi:hypothetical protein
MYYAQPVAQPYGVQPVYGTAQAYGAPQPVYGTAMMPQSQVYGAPVGVAPTQYYGYGGVAPAPMQPQQQQTSNPYVNTYLGHTAPAPASVAPVAAHAPGALPPGWEERRTPDGKVFYVDHNTKSTSWTRPAF